MIRNALNVSIRFTLLTAVLLGLVYPLVITGFAHLALRDKADGQLIMRDGKVVGSRILGQSFASYKYFHGRPCAAGNGYDATASGGSYTGPSGEKLVTYVQDTIPGLGKDIAPHRGL